jgi:hypothetical protein
VTDDAAESSSQPKRKTVTGQGQPGASPRASWTEDTSRATSESLAGVDETMISGQGGGFILPRRGEMWRVRDYEL